MVYQLSNNVNKDKIFLVNMSDIQGRIEPEFYKPSLYQLERKIRAKSNKRLKDYAQSFSGGATPSKKEPEKYYSDSTNGVPFLRVQNLQTTGELSLDECAYINYETHNFLLKRSQVSEGDLLIKITGVGRMAVASVAPKGFVGNTNQHMVVVKTGDINISRYLAYYLNLDIIERIASRYSTGGTRPALDYSSLKNIPIIDNIDFNEIAKAIEYKKKVDEQAQSILNSIDVYLLSELGIVLPKQNISLTNRIFTSKYSDVSGGRIDPKKHSISVKELLLSILNSPYKKEPLKSRITHISSGDWGTEYNGQSTLSNEYVKCLTLRATEIDNKYNLNINSGKVKYRILKQSSYNKLQISENDILIEKSGGSENQPVGRVAILDHDTLSATSDYKISYSNFLCKITVNNIDPMYLFFYLKTMYNIGITEVMQSQTNGIRNLIMDEYMSQLIVIPPMGVQVEIVKHITYIINYSKSLYKEGEEKLTEAIYKVEKSITD